jgi:tetratricopeptide (TPR) repeat protein
MDPAEGLGLAEDAATKAVRFDPSLAEAHLAMCGSIFLKTWQFQAANPECNRALELDPKDAEVYHFQSKMLAAVNRTQEALETQRIASRLDPLSRPWALGQAMLQARRYDEALSEARTRLESFPHDSTLLRLVSDIYRARGNEAQFAQYLEQSYRYGGDEPSATQVNGAFRDGGYKAVVRWHLARLVKQSANTYASPVDLAADYARLGDRKHALDMLDRALEQHATGLLWIRCEPAFDGLASDPRYRKILAQLPTG